MEITNLLLENRSMERSRAAQGITNWKRLLPNYDKKSRATFSKGNVSYAIVNTLPFVSEMISNQVNKLNTKQNETKVI